MRKIVICTTFRDFNGSFNDSLQMRFIDCLKKQTYQNFELAVTIFNEKNVEQVLMTAKLPVTIFRESSKEFRFSLTSVMLNGISRVNKNEEDMVVWMNSDLIFGHTLLEDLNNSFKKGFSATSYPHVYYQTEADYQAKGKFMYVWGGLDFIAFDAGIFANPEALSAIKNYKNINWGYFEYSMMGIAKLFSSEKINLWPNKVYKVANDRVANDEGALFFKLSTSVNEATMQRFLRDYHLSSMWYTWYRMFKYQKGYGTMRVLRFFQMIRLTFINKKMRAKSFLKPILIRFGILK